MLDVQMEERFTMSEPSKISRAELCQDAGAVFQRLQTSLDPLMVTERGKPVAIMLSVDAFEQRERELLFLRLFLRAEQEIAEGIGYDLDGVLAEAEAIVLNEPS